MNAIKTTLLLASMTGLMMAIGGVTGGRDGMLVMLVVSALLNLGTWFFADTMVIRSTGAKPVPEGGRLDWLHQDIAELAQRAGIPKPRLYITEDPSPNAFATGRSPSKGVVAVTAGLLNTLDRREIRGVLAHEIGHIAHRDTLISSVAATMAGVITWLSYSIMYGGRDEDRNPLLGLLAMILAPLAATIIRMAISRTREYSADRRAAEISGDPEGLAMALEGLSRGVQRRPMHNPAAANVHMIVHGFSGGLANLMSTHPPIEERVRRLRDMSR